jgi:hypothetical protein
VRRERERERERGREGVEREEDEVKTATTLIRKNAKSSVGTTTATVLRSIANGSSGPEHSGRHALPHQHSLDSPAPASHSRKVKHPRRGLRHTYAP